MRALPERSTTEPYRPAIVAGRYRVTEVLRKGPRSVVLLGADVRSDRAVVLKHVIEPSRAVAARMECLRPVQVQGRSLPALIDVVEARKDLWFIWERAPGVSLDQLWPMAPFLPTTPFVERWAHVRPIARALCQALATLHSHKLAHLDVKPENVRVEPCGQAWLVDLGTGEDNADSGPFSAPDLGDGLFVGRHADQWSLGALLYWMISSQLPCPGATAHERRVAADKGCPPLRQWRSDVPPAIDECIGRMLRRDAEQRHTTIEAVSQALGLEGESPVSAARERWNGLPQVLVGREANLQFPKRRTQELQNGRGGMVCVHTDAGTGKTAALLAGAEVARAEGCPRVIYSTCLPTNPREVLAPWFDDPAPEEAPGAVVDRVLAAFTEPTLLILDALELADGLSWARIERLAAAAILGQCPAPVFLVLAGRSMPAFSGRVPETHERRFESELPLLKRSHLDQWVRADSTDDEAALRTLLDEVWQSGLGHPEALETALVARWRRGELRAALGGFRYERSPRPALERPAGGPTVSALLAWIGALGGHVEVELLLACLPGGRASVAEALAFAAAHDLVRLRTFGTQWFAACRFEVPAEEGLDREVFARAAVWSTRTTSSPLGAERTARWWRAAGDTRAAGLAYMDAAAAHRRVGAPSETRRLAGLSHTVTSRAL